MAAAPAGIDATNVSAWFAGHVADAEPPLDFSIIAGGHSNLTYLVTDAAGRRFVLRRPPLSFLRPSAHDVGRECRVMRALSPTPVPVPEVLGYCDDASVTGATFYVMSYVEGWVPRERRQVEQNVPVSRRGDLAFELADTLAALHSVDADEVGLADLGRPQGYVERQLRRWWSQWESWKTREVRAVERLHDWLRESVPDQGAGTVVHGDFRLDNTIVAYGEPRIRAVLDWELSTLGDPLADLGMTLAYWVGPEEEPVRHLSSATLLEGFPTRAEIAERYAAKSGRDLSRIGFYVAFAYWKIAIILEGVYVRHATGALGESDSDLPELLGTVDRLLEAGEEAAAGLGYER